MIDADDRLGYYSLVSAVHNVQEVKFPSLMIVCIFFPPKMQACKLQTKAWLQSRDDVVLEYIEMFLSA